MSVRINNASLVSKNKKFCGICKAVGKSEEEYSSHFTKSAPGPKGVVICPLILSSVCKCCSKQGHFADHCPKRKPINVEIRIKSKPNSSTAAKSSGSNNMFHLLRDLEDDDVQSEPVVTGPAKKTFASVLASAPPPMKKHVSVSVSSSEVRSIPFLPNKPRRSWVDMMDSDSDDEDE
jgi:hypothetical protein